MDQNYTNDTKLLHYKDLDENVVRLTQKTEEPKSNKGNYFSHTTHTVNAIELESNKKVATPPISTSPSPLHYPPPY